jgi:hypothetical protein
MKYRSIVKEWEAASFSYSKIWMSFCVLFGIASIFLVPDIGGIRYSGFFVWFGINFFMQTLAKRLVWRLIGERFQALIPYDYVEAGTGKGILHSYRDVWNLMRGRLRKIE